MAGTSDVVSVIGNASSTPEGIDQPPSALWRYVPALCRESEEWRLRLVLHDFGLV